MGHPLLHRLSAPKRGGNDFAFEPNYTGQRLDDSGLIYYNARYYDPKLGQFISPDTIIPEPGNYLSYNRNIYGRGNPVSNNDPTGHIPQTSDNSSYLYAAESDGPDLSWAKWGQITNPSQLQGEMFAWLQDHQDINTILQMMNLLEYHYYDRQGIPQEFENVYANAYMGGQLRGLGTDNPLPGYVAAAILGGTIFGADSFQSYQNSTLLLTAKPYPMVIDLKTTQPVAFPTGNLMVVDKNLRVNWGKYERAAFIRDWYNAGYATPPGGWDSYDIHHIRPREYGGTNDFDNLTPVLRDEHRLFNRFWEQWGR